jgi:peptide methionine sulfoxide reductase MsrA
LCDAEDYHQEYLEKNPGGYCHINLGVLKPEERQAPIMKNSKKI